MNSTLDQPPGAALLTAEEFADRMDEFGPAELVKGRVVPMSLTNTTHAEVAAEICLRLKLHLRQNTIGKVFVGDVGIYTTRNPDSARGADVAFISLETLARRDESKPFLTVAPELVIEVVSPENRWQDVMDKLAEFFAIGVREIWLVNPQRRETIVYRSLTQAHLLSAANADVLTSESLLPGFALPLAELFEAR